MTDHRDRDYLPLKPFRADRAATASCTIIGWSACSTGLPERWRNALRWLRHPSARWARIPAAVLLILGGVLSILPILGLWMLPLGLILLAEDIPALHRSRARLLDWLERRRPHWFASDVSIDTPERQPLMHRSLPGTPSYYPGRDHMKNFQDREKGFEAEFKRNQDLVFRVTARRNKLFGLWVAEKLGLPADEVGDLCPHRRRGGFREARRRRRDRKGERDLAAKGID